MEFATTMILFQCFIAFVISGSSSAANSVSFSPCAKAPADILFALDASTSIGINNFGKEKNFVVNFVNDLDIGRNDVQVSVGTFSDNARGYFDLDTYLDKTSLINAIQRITYEFGQTHTHLVFQLAEQYIFTNKGGDRPFATNIIFVLTDGHSQNHTATVLGAQRLKAAGVKIYTIGIGNQIERSELQGIASDNNHVFMVNSFADLSTIHSLVQRAYCEGYSSTTSPTSTTSTLTTTQSTISPSKSTAPSSTNPTSPLTSKSTIASSPSGTTQTMGTSTLSASPTTTASVPVSSPSTSSSPSSTVTTQQTTLASTAFPTPPPIPDGPCEDKISNCAGYGGDVCNTYRIWSVKNCARFCLFCHDIGTSSTTTTFNVPSTTTQTTPTQPPTTRVYTVCEDKVDECSSYGPDTCFKYASWAAVQSPKFCVFCEPTTTTGIATTTTETTAAATTITTTTTSRPAATSPPVCADVAENCQDFGPIICFQNQTYAEANCRVYCNFCTPPATTLRMTEPPVFQSSTTQKILTTNPDVIVIGRKRNHPLRRRLLGYKNLRKV
ncbi:mucin-2-like [Ostrea edulis]|uniref:mucin-2-like n=1 Tax=Ostrea edulis TaxID=37623 RepID=UPI0024AF0313|nr:mucin-2-like [Ostrea edulis]